MVKIILISLLCLGTFFSTTQAQEVHVIAIDGPINPAVVDNVHTAIQRAVRENAECLIIQLNTPGGLLKSTRLIVSDLLTSPIPVIVYVSPSGAQAASAGVFITLAAHIAAMAPGTNIGAAHPVSIGEKLDSIMIEKATNDAAAFIRTISEKRNRNVRWAEDAVRKSLSITETEALKEKVIDTIATSVDELLTAIDNKEIETTQGKKILNTKDAIRIYFQPSAFQKFLDILSDPNIAYILLMLGIYGLLFELYNPGSIFPGVVGVICLILSFYSLHTLPINFAGLALIIFGIILFILETQIVSHGLLTIGGIISLTLGSIMLIQADSALEFVTLSWEVIIITVILTSLFFIFAIGAGLKAQKKKPITGIQGLKGEIGETLTDLHPEGTVKVHGEIWSAISLDGTIKKGSKIQVEEIENLKLKVRKVIH